MGDEPILDAERSLLGAMLLDTEAYPKVAELVSATDFADRTLAAIFTAYVTLYDTTREIDTLTLHAHLQGKVPAALLLDLTIEVSTAAHVVSYAKIVRENALKRRVARLGTKIESAISSGDGDASSVLERAEKAIAKLADGGEREPIASMADILGTTLDRIEAAERGELTVGLSTGYREMDAVLAGLQPSDLVILAARPSMGKTAFALNLARNAALHSEAATLIFSLEMSKGQLVDRMVSMECGVSTERLRSGRLGEHDTGLVMAATGVLADLPVYIDDTPSISVATLRTRARRHAALHGLELIIVDYLQLMGGKQTRQSNRVEEISEISRGLKAVARELNVPVIALSQLSRQVEARDVKIPQLSDLRDSGAIEQDADVVAFLYRDDYYNPDTPRRNMTDLLIRKHRNGRLGSVELYFDRNQQRFRGLTA